MRTTITVEQVAATWLSAYTSPNTQAAYGRDFDAFAGWCGAQGFSPLAASPSHVERYRADRSAAGTSPATIARHVSALRAFYDHAVEVGAVGTHPLPRTARRVAPIASSETSVLSVDAAQRLLQASRVDHRTAVLVHLLLHDGIRLAEALGLDHEHVTGPAAAKVITVRRHGRDHRITLLAASSAALTALQRRSRLTADRRGPLFVSTGGATAGRRISRFGADQLIRDAPRRAGVGEVSSNVLRHTHAAIARHRGDRDEEIRARMGHRDVRTTRRYLATPPP